VNSTISRPTEKLVAFIDVLLLGDSQFDLPVANKGTGSMKRNPHFYRLRNETVRKKSAAGRSTERCERDFLKLVLRVSNSNEIRNEPL
jgi:hypothetical protein